MKYDTTSIVPQQPARNGGRLATITPSAKTILCGIAALIAAQGITPTPEAVIGLAIRALVDGGKTPLEAFDAIMGGGSFQSLSDSLWEEFNA